MMICQGRRTGRRRAVVSGRSGQDRRELMRRGRRLHVIDVENLLGTGRRALPELRWCERTYRQLGIVAPQDLRVVASSPFVAVDLGRAWRCRLLIGHGPDGADRALLRVLSQEQVDRRFTEVVVACGDGTFSATVAWLRRHHVEVSVVARSAALSSRLGLAADRYLGFPPAAPTHGAAAAAA